VAEVAHTAADVVATAALFGAGSLLLGAVAGWFGGRLGTIAPTMTLPRGGSRGSGRSTTTTTDETRVSGVRRVEARTTAHGPANGGDPRSAGDWV
jgi:hypothetical protein